MSTAASVWARLGREFSVGVPAQTVDQKKLWDTLRTCEDAATLEALIEFGAVLVAEVQARTALLDSKASTYLAWNAGIAAIFLAAVPRIQSPSSGWFALAGAIAAACGAIFAFAALHVQEFKVPSQPDWFDIERCDDALRLRRAHLLSLRDWHQGDNETNRWKSFYAKNAQWCLLVAGLMMGIASVIAILPATT